MLCRYSSSCGINLVLGLPWVFGIHDPKWVLVRTIVHDVYLNLLNYRVFGGQINCHVCSTATT